MRGVLRRALGGRRSAHPRTPGPAAVPPSLGRAGGQKRVLAALTAVVLLVSGWWTYAVDHAPAAHATTAAGTVTAELDVSVLPGSVTSRLGTLSGSVTYTCTRSTLPNGRAQLRLEFVQGVHNATAEVSVPCGPGVVDRTQQLSTLDVFITTRQEITVTAILTNGAETITSTADTVSTDIYVHLDSSATYSEGGTVRLSGYYLCGSGFRTPGTAFISAEQLSPENVPAAGYATVPITTCDNTYQTWSVTFADALLGAPPFTAGLPLSARAETGIATALAGGNTSRADTSADYAAVGG
ncbi:hypothetical protein AB0C52_26420 [Streptomyces sp. NPDC048717]|uniref:hypothetical protein n=1 Tax=Streptomyces sp. NPDC048717 TaxID=3154928 RepID=UPI0034401A0B